MTPHLKTKESPCVLSSLRERRSPDYRSASNTAYNTLMSLSEALLFTSFDLVERPVLFGGHGRARVGGPAPNTNSLSVPLLFIVSLYGCNSSDLRFTARRKVRAAPPGDNFPAPFRRPPLGSLSGKMCVCCGGGMHMHRDCFRSCVEFFLK